MTSCKSRLLYDMRIEPKLVYDQAHSLHLEYHLRPSGSNIVYVGQDGNSPSIQLCKQGNVLQDVAVCETEGVVHTVHVCPSCTGPNVNFTCACFLYVFIDFHDFSGMKLGSYLKTARAEYL